MYGHNTLDRRRQLWNDLRVIDGSIQGPWFIIGDFNNVLCVGDRIGGHDVAAYEYADLQDMMDNIGLFEHNMIGPHFTWSNKHVQGVIY